jgi:hypothetical protein
MSVNDIWVLGYHHSYGADDQTGITGDAFVYGAGAYPQSTSLNATIQTGATGPVVKAFLYVATHQDDATFVTPAVTINGGAAVPFGAVYARTTSASPVSPGYSNGMTLKPRPANESLQVFRADLGDGSAFNLDGNGENVIASGTAVNGVYFGAILVILFGQQVDDANFQSAGVGKKIRHVVIVDGAIKVVGATGANNGGMKFNIDLGG